MKTQLENNLKVNLTEKEFEMLNEIVSYFDMDDNICYTRELTPSQKGIVGSLVKKELVVEDSYELEEGNNFMPTNKVLDIYGVDHY